ncbi:hypothetical protein TNCV_723731 [Trichonephila clavipes]|nr:hypothetical protein TNCV_723731 [Trichonephila clavipes]
MPIRVSSLSLDQSSNLPRFIANNPHGGVNKMSRCEINKVAVVAKWSRYRIIAVFVTSSCPLPLKTRRIGERCTLNLSRAQTSSWWCGN